MTGYLNRLDDAIANITVGTNLRRRGNVEAIRAAGVEVTAAVDRGPWSATASYAFSDSHVRAPGLALDGRIPAQSPRHAASATLGWQAPHGPGLAATLRHVGLQYEDDLQTDRLPAVTTLDAVASVPIVRRLLVVARAENLGDARVVTRNAAGSIDLGTSRTLWIGLRFGR